VNVCLVFCAFDLLALDGEDQIGLSLVERKLREIMPRVESRVMFLDGVGERGAGLFRAACERNLEGIVAKWAHGQYSTDGRMTSWLQVKNPDPAQGALINPQGWHRYSYAFGNPLTYVDRTGESPK
jgi:ATP-dependent DNA ligase